MSKLVKERSPITFLKKWFSWSGRRRRAGIASDRESVLRKFERRAGVRFQDLEILEEALTHRSYSSRILGEEVQSNQRLEFLGDSVLGVIVSQSLYQEEPSWREGDLTKRKSILVSKTMLAERARVLGLGRFLRLSDEELEAGGDQRDSALADALEAIIGALYVDSGLEAAAAFVRRQILSPVSAVDVTDEHPNYKSELQERVQAQYQIHPRYRVTKTEGPDHNKIFTVEVSVVKKVVGVGSGRCKKEAEQNAAREALTRQPWSLEPGEDRKAPGNGLT